MLTEKIYIGSFTTPYGSEEDVKSKMEQLANMQEYHIQKYQNEIIPLYSSGDIKSVTKITGFATKIKNNS